MATESPSAGDSLKIFIDGQQIELIVRIRQSNPALHGQTLTDLTVATVGNWIRAWKAIKSDTWKVDSKSAEEQYGVTRSEHAEPYVTVFNKDWNGLSITVHSHENGQGAVTAAAAFLSMRDFIQDKTPQLFQATTPTPAPSAAPKKDINDVDSFLNDPATHGVTPPQASAKQGNVYVRPAMAGSIPNTIKLQKGAKGKETFEMAILPTTPYSSNAADFQEKDMIAYPIQGAIRYEGSSSGFYFAIPVPQSEIRIYVREATNFDGKTIESDSQKLAQHLGLKDMELSQGMKWNVPATHIAMKVGKTGDKGQYKNYVGLYELK